MASLWTLVEFSLAAILFGAATIIILLLAWSMWLLPKGFNKPQKPHLKLLK